MYWIPTLICRDLRDRIVEGGGWSNLHTEWTKAHLSIIQEEQINIPNQKFGWKLGAPPRVPNIFSPNLLFANSPNIYGEAKRVYLQ